MLQFSRFQSTPQRGIATDQIEQDLRFVHGSAIVSACARSCVHVCVCVCVCKFIAQARELIYIIPLRHDSPFRDFQLFSPFLREPGKQTCIRFLSW